MNKLDDILFELIQVAVGTRSSLSCVLSADEWAQLRLEFKKQALLGIGYVGITKLSQHQTPPIQVLAQWVHNSEKIRKKNQRLNEECANVCQLLAHDGFDVCVLKGQSNLINYPEDIREYRTAGDIDVWVSPKNSIEIGESVNGKIEVREYKGIEAVIEYFLQWNRAMGVETPWHRVLYYHMEVSTKSGTTVEPHYRPSFLLNAFHNRRLQKWFRENEQFGMVRWGYKNHDHNQTKNPAENKGDDSFKGSSQHHRRQRSSGSPLCGQMLSTSDISAVASKSTKNPLENQEENLSLPIPTNSFNAVYQLVHIFRHLFEEGIGLRQLLDYYFVMRSLHIEQGEHSDRTTSMAMWEEGLGRSVLSNQQIMHLFGRFGMKKFASAAMYVLKTAFAMPDAYLLCEPNEKEGKWLLNEIMLAGNFGQHDERIKHGGSQLSHAWEKTKHNLRLLPHYPEEVMWEPLFRLYHWLWRRFEWWK